MSGRTLNPVAFARALADDTRQQIMGLCCCRWRSVGELTEALAVAQPTVSHHLAILREAGLVQQRKDGKQTFYTLNQDRVAFCCGQLMLKFAPEAETTAAVQELV
ncbi:MAG: winged helix-turn-helix transcriptional regulator [Chloroflexi bacterium]|nr:winged helix-turn-helix transcriptional regulator [Chloroflexota bacterium]